MRARSAELIIEETLEVMMIIVLVFLYQGSPFGYCLSRTPETVHPHAERKYRSLLEYLVR